jgi:hypothetical protein
MTSARVFYTLLAAIVVTGLPASFVPAWERLWLTGCIVAAALAVATAVAVDVAAEIRWSREMDRVINAPATRVATVVAATEMVAR